jgi:hypothetical protein
MGAELDIFDKFPNLFINYVTGITTEEQAERIYECDNVWQVFRLEGVSHFGK